MLLSPYTALDLTDDKGLFCGRLLADLGMRVIKVERPGGDAARAIGPFYQNEPHPEKSLSWLALNTGKLGVTLDIANPSGKALFRRLSAKADVVIESFPPGYFERIGLGYAALRDDNPRLVMTSISPFGATGPHRDFKAGDLVGAAMSGVMFLVGDRDRPPVRISCPQSYLHAAGQATVGTLIALTHAAQTGHGQQVDVSMQESMIPCTLNSVPFAWLRGTVLAREGALRSGRSDKVLVRQTWECKDGLVAFQLLTGGHKLANRTNRGLLELMVQDGAADDFLRGLDWQWFFDEATAPDGNQALVDQVEERVARYFRTRTKMELFAEAAKRDILLHPIATPSDILANPQLQARGFWEEIEHPALDATLVYPGLPFTLSEPMERSRRRAPLIGEHNEQIYCDELGLSRDEFRLLAEQGVI